ncbi:hypothetical protein GQ53DRAFT_759188 [Thozetella sp. PMI_491]|nr:hypothetical protein GQ53DRAFT_759188 [Thozetella sp. PMI_491]
MGHHSTRDRSGRSSNSRKHTAQKPRREEFGLVPQTYGASYLAPQDFPAPYEAYGVFDRLAPIEIYDPELACGIGTRTKRYGPAYPDVHLYPSINAYHPGPVSHPFTEPILGEKYPPAALFPRPFYQDSYRSRKVPKTKYASAQVLILTWAFHDLRGGYDVEAEEDIVSLDEETDSVRETFEKFGYKVREGRIPMEDSAEKMKILVDKFLRRAAPDALLIVYYHGHGGLDEDGGLVFSSHEHPSDTQICQDAAADLYKAMAALDTAPKRTSMITSLKAKYERFRPIAEVKWEKIRDSLLQAPCDLLLVLDCCAAGGANLKHVDWQPEPMAEGFAKHLYAACGFESSSRGEMTAGLCDALDVYYAEETGKPLTTKRLHQIVEDRLQKKSVGAQPIFKQLLPVDGDKHITLPVFL